MTNTTAANFTMKADVYGCFHVVNGLPDHAACVAAWKSYRDETGCGASDCGPVVIMVGETVVARIAYNGTVYELGDFYDRVLEVSDGWVSKRWTMRQLLGANDFDVNTHSAIARLAVGDTHLTDDFSIERVV